MSLTSHYDTILLLSFLSALELLGLGLSRSHWNTRITGCGGSDNGQPLLSSLVSLLSRADIPHVCFQGISSAADAHLCKVGYGVLCFCQTCNM